MPPTECWEQKAFSPDGFAGLIACLEAPGSERLHLSCTGQAGEERAAELLFSTQQLLTGHYVQYQRSDICQTDSDH